MNKRLQATVVAVVISTTAVLVLLYLLGGTNPGFPVPALAASLQIAPTVILVEPAIVANDIDTAILITGADFVAVLSGTAVITPPAVLLDSTALPDVGWVTSTTLTSTVLSGFSVGVYTVTVTNPDGFSGSLPSGLTVRNPTPLLQGVSPDSGIYGQAIILTITGTHFVPTPTVTLDGTTCAGVGFVSSTTLTATVPGSLLPEVYDLAVRNPGPGDPHDVLADAFTLYNPTPTVTAMAPHAAPNDLDTQVIITGASFVLTPTVTLGTTRFQDVTWVSSTQLAALVPWGIASGTYSLTVTNPGPGAPAAVLADAFTVTNGIGVFTTDGPYGGAIYDIEKKPGTPTTVFALASGVGLFVSENSGEEWRLVYSARKLTQLTFDAQDADVMYLGSWSPQEFARSLDGGQTWETTPQISFPASGDGWSFPAAHPTDAGTVFVGIGHGEEESPPNIGGVFRSDDYMVTWITKTEGMTDTNVHSIAIHPNDPNKMLAGTWHGNVYASLDGGENWSLSTNLDDPVRGVYFNPYQPLEAWATGGGLTAYLYTSTNLIDWTAVVVDSSAEGGYLCDLTFLTDTIWASTSWAYTSTDGGATWTEVPGLYDGANVVAVTPENPQEIYVGHWKGVDRSENSGQTWQQVNEGLAGIVPDAIAVPRAETESVYVDTNQGLFRSLNGGHSWQDLDHGGGGAWGDWLVADPYTPTRIYLGGKTQCIDAFCIEISPDSGETWNLVTTTLPITYAGWESAAYALAPHPQIPGRILAGNWVWHPDSAPWLEDTLAVVYASDDYGQHWAFMGPTQPISSIMDIAYDAVDPNLVYMATAGSGQWKSTDGGATWQPLPFTRAGFVGDEFAPHPTLSGHLVLATYDQNNGAGLFSSQNAGETWKFLTDGVNSPLVYAPTFPPTLYGKTESPQYSGLMRSFDNGQTWGQVPAAPCPTRLATATDGERVVLYIGSPGGLATQAGVQTTLASRAVVEQSTLLGGGVYRLTTLLPTDWVYLPLVLKGHTP